MEDNFVFNLTELLKYTPKGKGDFEETGTIEFEPPSMKVFDESTDFEQIILKSMMTASKLQKSEKKEDEEDETPTSLADMKVPSLAEMRIVLHAGDVSIREIAKKFKFLAVKTGYLDEKTRLKNSHFDKMEKKDFMDMMCGYACFFTFPSLLRGEEQNENGSQ
jgi:hypothetical protein